MKVLDLDMDYFMKSVATFINESEPERLPEEDYGDSVWSEREVRNFLEGNLGLSKQNRIRGRVVAGHNESLFFWRELIEKGDLSTPFDVIHVDSHADLGLGYSSWTHILDYLLYYPVEERSQHPRYFDTSGHLRSEGIGDYLLFAVAYRWISSIVYCGNPHGECNDYLLDTLKDFKEEPIWDKPVQNTIQLLYNPDMPFPQYNDTEYVKRQYIRNSRKEPEVPFLIIPTIEDVHFDGNYDFAVLAQSPNYPVIGHSLKEHTVNSFDGNGLFWIYYKVSVWATVVAKKSLEGNGDLTVCKSLSLAPCTVGKCRKDQEGI